MASLDHIRWLGGGTGAGKSTIARRLAARAGVEIYSTDGSIPTHGARMTARTAPLLECFRRMSMDQRWVLRDPAEMYRSFPWFHGEGFELLMEDLQALPDDRITVVEGFRLLPDLVRPHLSSKGAAVWLLSTPTFRQAALAGRRGTEAFWMRTSDPARALSNLCARDEIFAGELAATAARDGLRTITLDGAQDLEATTAVIADLLNL